MFTLFEKINHIGPWDIPGFSEDIGDHLISYDTYWLNYTIFPSFEEYYSGGKKPVTHPIQIDSDLDPENLSNKDPIKFCENHNDAQLKIIQEHHIKLSKEDASYKYESNETGPEIKYYEKIHAKFRRWYRKNNIDLPGFDNIDEFLILKGINPSFLTEQNKLLEDHQKDVSRKPKNPYHKKDTSKEVKQFINIVLKEHNDWPNLELLEKKTDMSKSSWSRRLNEKEFLDELLKLIDDIEKKGIGSEDINLLGHTITEIANRKNKLEKKSSKPSYSDRMRLYDDSQKVDQSDDKENTEDEY